VAEKAAANAVSVAVEVDVAVAAENDLA